MTIGRNKAYLLKTWDTQWQETHMTVWWPIFRFKQTWVPKDPILRSSTRLDDTNGGVNTILKRNKNPQQEHGTKKTTMYRVYPQVRPPVKMLAIGIPNSILCWYQAMSMLVSSSIGLYFLPKKISMHQGIEGASHEPTGSRSPASCRKHGCSQMHPIDEYWSTMDLSWVIKWSKDHDSPSSWDSEKCLLGPPVNNHNYLVFTMILQELIVRNHAERWWLCCPRVVVDLYHHKPLLTTMISNYIYIYIY